MSAIDILKKLDGIEAVSLRPYQRILLVTDGTLTEILEAIFLERIQLIKVSQEVISATASHADLEADSQEALLERKILLRGETSGRNYVYAESVIALERLSPAFRDGLIKSAIPLGRLWLEHKLETFKDVPDVRCQPADGIHRHFGCQDSSPLLVRTYRVNSGTKPVMLISEYFQLDTTHDLPARVP